jgi:hypothetical protein
MMGRLIARGQEIARNAVETHARSIASELRELLGDVAVSLEETKVLVRGRRILQRWLADPALRFLGRSK